MDRVSGVLFYPFASIFAKPQKFLLIFFTSSYSFSTRYFLFLFFHFLAKEKKKEGKEKKDDEKGASRSAVRGFVRALVSSPQHPAITSVADPVLRSVSAGAGSAAAVVIVVEAVFASDLAGRIRFAAVRDFAGADAVRIGDVLHRIHTDAVDSRIGDGVLCGRDRLEPLHVGTLDSLLRHGSFQPAEGDSCMESIVNTRTRRRVRQRDTELHNMLS